MHTAVDGTRLSWHQVRRRPDTPHLRFAPPPPGRQIDACIYAFDLDLKKTDFTIGSELDYGTDVPDDDDEDEEEDDDESSEGLSI